MLKYKILKSINLVFIYFLAPCLVLGQKQENAENRNVIKDNFYNEYLAHEKRPLAYPFIHEKDVFWEKRVWRLINVNEAQNKMFLYPNRPFVKILMDAAERKEITLYHVYRDDFSVPMSYSETQSLGVSVDTICIFDPEDLTVREPNGNTLMDANGVVLDSARLAWFFEHDCAPVYNEFDYAAVKNFRLKEVYFFDEETSSFGVRILGIAPIVDRFDDAGNFLNSGPLFWVYYPAVRPILAREKVFNRNNDVGMLSWEDIFEARMFSSYIIKASNNLDDRIKDRYSNPMTALLEAQKIKAELFEFEHNLWSY